MERKPIVRHYNGSVTTEGENEMQKYLNHEFDHAKGHGDDEEHKEQWGHDAMHALPHNDNIVDDIIKSRKFGPKSFGGGHLSDLHEKPDVM